MAGDNMRKVTVNASRTYDILIGKGLIDCAGELCRDVIGMCRVAILTDSNVAPLYAKRLEIALGDAGYETVRYTVRAGEASKNAENYIGFLSFLAQNHLTRSDLIIALGGGVVGDLAGFAAATYLRGVRFVQVPTTLLAMVDSSVGGKTAIDIPEGKNLVGAFYQPSLVICDYETLGTLDASIFADGCAEVIKYGVINDRELFENLKSPIMPQIADVIESCVKNKRNIVNADERDTGVRQLLNLGHTAAHSIEALSHFEISHGSAVAIGMMIITRSATARGLCPESDLTALEEMLARYSLPILCPYGAKELSEIALSDKKRSGGYITLVVPHGIGDSRLEKVGVDALCEIFQAGL